MVEPITTNFKQLNDKYINSSFIKLEHSAISVDNEISFLYKVDEKFLYLYEIERFLHLASKSLTR